MNPRISAFLLMALLGGGAVVATTRADTPRAEPICLHPDNPHYFHFRGRPTVLITAGEHYGAVLNLDFDYGPYLDELQAHGFNLTRVFSGTYREVPGSFNITGNTLAPAAGRFVCPWARSGTPGAADGGDKFDLTKWDQAYLSRLKDFIAQAGRRGVVVELVLFCTMYDDKLWDASPMNVRNNVNDIGRVGRSEVYSAKDKDVLAVQQAVVRKLVAELNAFGNLYFEICNEPYERGGLTSQWNDLIVAAIVETEVSLPKKHLIAQGFPPSPRAVSGLNPHISILNFHAAKSDAVRLNYPLNKVVAFDETGGADRRDRKYRTEGWEFLLAGGGVYDHLDLSFTPDREDGTAVPLPPGTPGGGGPELRRQLAVLKRFIESFDFIHMKPDLSIVQGPLPVDVSIQVLAEPGRAYAIYLKGGTQADLTLDLPVGSYQAEWIDTKTGRVAQAEPFEQGGGSRTLASPVYSEDIALRIRAQSKKGAR